MTRQWAARTATVTTWRHPCENTCCQKTHPKTSIRCRSHSNLYYYCSLDPVLRCFQGHKATPTPGEIPRDVPVLCFLHHELVLVDADAWTFYNNPGTVFFTRGLRNGSGLPKSRMQIHKLTELNLVHFLNSSLSYAVVAWNSTMTSLGTGASNSKKQVHNYENCFPLAKQKTSELPSWVVPPIHV